MNLPYTSNNLLFWLDAAEKFVNYNGNKQISSVIHKLDGNLITVLEPTARPTWLDNQINGYPVINFNGNCRLIYNFNSNVFSASNGRPFMVSAIARVTGSDANIVFDMGSQTAAPAHHALLLGSASGYYVRQDDTGNYISTDLVVTTDSRYHLHTLAYDGTNLIYKKDGIIQTYNLLTSGSLFNSPISLNQMAIGGFCPLIGVDNFLTGQVAEVVAYCSGYNQPLDYSPEEYLLDKYNL